MSDNGSQFAGAWGSITLTGGIAGADKPAGASGSITLAGDVGSLIKLVSIEARRITLSGGVMKLAAPATSATPDITLSGSVGGLIEQALDDLTTHTAGEPPRTPITSVERGIIRYVLIQIIVAWIYLMYLEHPELVEQLLTVTNLYLSVGAAAKEVERRLGGIDETGS